MKTADEFNPEVASLRAARVFHNPPAIDPVGQLVSLGFASVFLCASLRVCVFCQHDLPYPRLAEGLAQLHKQLKGSLDGSRKFCFFISTIKLLQFQNSNTLSLLLLRHLFFSFFLFSRVLPSFPPFTFLCSRFPFHPSIPRAPQQASSQTVHLPLCSLIRIQGQALGFEDPTDSVMCL